MKKLINMRRTISVIAAIVCMSSFAVYASAETAVVNETEQQCSTVRDDIVPAEENRKEVSAIADNTVPTDENEAYTGAEDENIITKEKVYEVFGVLEGKVIAEPDELILGDVNGDGNIDVSDIAAVSAHISGKKALDEDAAFRADINGDGCVDITDISMIAAHVKGIKAI